MENVLVEVFSMVILGRKGRVWIVVKISENN